MRGNWGRSGIQSQMESKRNTDPKTHPKPTEESNAWETNRRPKIVSSRQQGRRTGAKLKITCHASRLGTKTRKVQRKVRSQSHLSQPEKDPEGTARWGTLFQCKTRGKRVNSFVPWQEKGGRRLPRGANSKAIYLRVWPDSGNACSKIFPLRNFQRKNSITGSKALF